MEAVLEIILVLNAIQLFLHVALVEVIVLRSVMHDIQDVVLGIGTKA